MGDAHMSGRDNITRPEAVQLPASFCSLLSRKSFSNFVPVLTDENSSTAFHSSSLFLSVSAYQHTAHPAVCQAIRNPLAQSKSNVGKQWTHNCCILFVSATQMIIFWVPHHLKNSSDCWIFPWSLDFIFYPCLCTDSKFVEANKYWKRIS